MKQMITQSRLKEIFTYDKTSGVLAWKISTSNRVRPGDIVGYVNKDSGYLMVGVDGSLYRAHRLIWLYMYGYLPEQIDHQDHNRLNNSLSNLVESNNKLNRKNMSIHKHNTSGVMGVSFSLQKNKFRSRIDVDKKQIHLGFFDSKAIATEARRDAEYLYGFHANHNK